MPDTPPMPFDAEFLADPHAGFARLRQQAPVHRIRTPDGAAAWLVTRYADVRAALADPRLSLDKANSAGRGFTGFALPPALDANLLNMDPPDHTRLRRLVSRAFTPRYVERMRDRVQAITDELLDAVAPLGRADLVASLAAPVSAMTICEVLGVEEADRADFRSWVEAMVAPDPRDPARAKERMRSAIGQMAHYLTDLVARKRRAPGEDLLSSWVTARDAEDRLSEDELTSLAFLTLMAGYENPVHLIGKGALTLAQRPELAAELRERPELVVSAVDELMRYDGPQTLAIRRFPLEDVEIGGVRVPAGETVLLSLMSANRDPDQFARADELDIHRADNQHVALGHGIHFCLGASLTRVQAQVALGTVVRRFPDLALAVPAAELRWRPSHRSHGLLELPVVFTPTSRSGAGR
ncbi:cytochrome P450 family protein [Streptoalloteichus hindustanus]|uniref:Cytochrome P450 n=1 Tax=Streptoalloteichus hindustanus TaxID=2017 RepID=A0A1M5NIU1_STRHI|nr:cytochrome P450 [Streptoalloteichus hindustanus]SHG89441.1 Cytochrome P450 [Streptoalloteichus hindustanus]